MDLSRRLAMLAVLALAGCTAHAALPSGAMRVPTDDNLVSFGSEGILCGLATPRDLPPTGVLEGDPSDPEWPVWIQKDDGTRRYVVWPRDYSVRFDPDAALLDETGRPILLAGSPLDLAYLTTDPTPGTKDLPWIAESFTTGLARIPHCYTRDD
jgi:hypothetical protein